MACMRCLVNKGSDSTGQLSTYYVLSMTQLLDSCEAESIYACQKHPCVVDAGGVVAVHVCLAEGIPC